jgi:hypothetical protein
VVRHGSQQQLRLRWLRWLRLLRVSSRVIRNDGLSAGTVIFFGHSKKVSESLTRRFGHLRCAGVHARPGTSIQTSADDYKTRNFQFCAGWRVGTLAGEAWTAAGRVEKDAPVRRALRGRGVGWAQLCSAGVVSTPDGLFAAVVDREWPRIGKSSIRCPLGFARTLTRTGAPQGSGGADFSTRSSVPKSSSAALLPRNVLSLPGFTRGAAEPCTTSPKRLSEA